MTAVDGPWSAADLQDFLEQATIPLRLAVLTPAGRPWIVPLWFLYRDGTFRCATGRDAEIIERIEANPAVGFDVSTNEVPYRGVRGHGRVTVSPDEDKRLLRELLERYLGGTDSALATSLLADDREEVKITIQPDRLVTWDYASRMQDV
ncbi:MAG: pyridoxamine 5'-phosphate oxidase family protein [Salinirussus sp.]